MDEIKTENIPVPPKDPPSIPGPSALNEIVDAIKNLFKKKKKKD